MMSFLWLVWLTLSELSVNMGVSNQRGLSHCGSWQVMTSVLVPGSHAEHQLRPSLLSTTGPAEGSGTYQTPRSSRSSDLGQTISSTSLP